MSGVVSSLAPNSVKAVHIAADAVDGSHLAADAVGGAHIADDAVDGTHIAADAVGGTHIAADAVGGAHIAADAVDGAHIVADAISESEVGLNFNGASSVVITPGNAWTPAAGVYLWVNNTAGTNFKPQMHDGAAWRGNAPYYAAGGFFFTDGTNFRLLKFTDAGNSTIYYRKLA